MKAIIEKYTSDYNRKSETKTFTSLTELENWIFGQMQQNYSRNRYAMWFPLPESVKKYKRDGPGSIEFRPCCGGEDILIHQIESNDGIIFSDGRFTSGQKHWTIDVQNWLVHCEQRRKSPKFNFAYENSQQKPQPEPQQMHGANSDVAISPENMAHYLMDFCHCHLAAGKGCRGCPFNRPSTEECGGACRLGVPSNWDF